ncbi:hypothetical protein GCM10010038_20530 [Glutamicibacter protophormiae]|nr:hypothetical protein GCM10010038_20530 [Glutamicibacter protophormiae]
MALLGLLCAGAEETGLDWAPADGDAVPVDPESPAQPDRANARAATAPVAAHQDFSDDFMSCAFLVVSA